MIQRKNLLMAAGLAVCAILLVTLIANRGSRTQMKSHEHLGLRKLHSFTEIKEDQPVLQTRSENIQQTQEHETKEQKEPIDIRPHGGFHGHYGYFGHGYGHGYYHGYGSGYYRFVHRLAFLEI